MSIRRVRIYGGKDNEADLIGFSAGASYAPEDPRFAGFMSKRNYAWSIVSDHPEGSVSIRHVEVRPPLSEEHVQELGILCVGGILDGERSGGIVDPYHDGVLVLDNRRILPEGPFGTGVVIAKN